MRYKVVQRENRVQRGLEKVWRSLNVRRDLEIGKRRGCKINVGIKLDFGTGNILQSSQSLNTKEGKEE